MKKTSKKAFNIALASTMVAGAVVAIAPTQADAAIAFPDVKDTNSHYENIMNLVERGIIKGYEDGTFKPGESIKRGHAAKIIAGVLGLDTENVKNPGFKDISTKNPYYGAIAALSNAGIINGFEDNTYRHNDTLTRGQMAKIIANAFDLQAGDAVNPFTDVKNSQYVDYITALFANNVTTGKTATTFDAKSPVTRAQLASFVVRAENVKENDQEQNQEQTVTVKILEVTDTTVVTDKGTFAIEGDLTKVFNASNAAALKDAEIEVVVHSKLTASLNFVAAGESKLSTLKSLTLVADNATFNAGGFEIPQLTVSGKNLKVENVKVAKLTVGQGLTLTLTNVDVAEIDATKGAKITLDPTSTIGKVTLPKNLKITDVVTNYNQVKDLIKEVTVDQNATAPSIGGGGGGGGNNSNPSTPSESATEKAIDKAVGVLLEEYLGTIDDYGTVDFDKNDNIIEFTFTLADNTTIAEVRESLLENSNGISLADLISDGGLTFAEAGTILDNATSVKITAGSYTKTFDATDFITISESGADVDRHPVVVEGDAFVDAAIEASGQEVKTVGQFKDVFADNITIKIGEIKYSVKVK